MNIDLKVAAAYIRVSTDSQTELSPDSQIKTVRQFAKQHGYIIPNEYIFRDDGISGRRADKRPAFNNMIAAAKQKPSPFCAVLLWKFSRFARNQEESVFYKSMLRKNGVDVVSVSEPTVEGPFGSLIERIIEWTDEYYSIRLSGEVKRGMTERVERGGAVSIPAFGYDIVNKQYVINPETAPIVKRIFADYLSGIPIVRIARQLNEQRVTTTKGNVWENRTVEYILYNPVYIGKIRWNPKRRTRRNYDDPDIMIVDGNHEPIIDTDTFEQVQQRLAAQKKAHPRNMHTKINEEYMLHGLVKCSACGASLSMCSKGIGLQCIKYTHGKCNTSHYISINKLNKLVIAALEVAFETESFELTVKDRPAAAELTEIDIDAMIDKEQKKFARIREAYENGVYTLDELKESKRIADHNIAEWKKKAVKPENTMGELVKAFIEKKKDIIPQLKSDDVTESEKNELLRSFVDKIIFNRTSETIRIFYYT